MLKVILNYLFRHKIRERELQHEIFNLKVKLQDQIEVNKQHDKLISQLKPKNLCQNCKPASFVEDVELITELGECSNCSEVTEIIDIELINFYKSLNISKDDIVYSYLPITRYNYLKKRNRIYNLNDITNILKDNNLISN